jgi:hypothetical protein
MKKLKWYEILLVVFAVAVLTLALMSCTKEPDMKDIIEPQIFSEVVVSKIHLKVGEKFTITTIMPTEWSYDFRAHTDYTRYPDRVKYGRIVEHSYNKVGTYLIYGAGQDSTGQWMKTYQSCRVQVK